MYAFYIEKIVPVYIIRYITGQNREYRLSGYIKKAKSGSETGEFVSEGEKF